MTRDILYVAVPLGLAYLLLRSLRGPPVVEPPLVPIAPPAPGEEPSRLDIRGAAELGVRPGRTYFAVLETSGTVGVAANEARVKEAAEARGFRDVAVFKARPPSFPGTARGDYYVRATFMGPEEKFLPLNQSVFLGHFEVLDAWIAAE